MYSNKIKMVWKTHIQLYMEHVVYVSKWHTKNKHESDKFVFQNSMQKSLLDMEDGPQKRKRQTLWSLFFVARSAARSLGYKWYKLIKIKQIFIINRGRDREIVDLQLSNHYCSFIVQVDHWEVLLHTSWQIMKSKW